MRVLDGLAHGTKQVDASVQGAGVQLTVLGERHSFHVFHGKPWSAIGQGIGIVEACDGGMIQLRESSLLAGETLAASWGKPGIAQDLNRD